MAKSKPKAPAYQQYEYCLLQLAHEAPDAAVLAEKMNELGADGWECVGAEGHFVIFLRPV